MNIEVNPYAAFNSLIRLSTWACTLTSSAETLSSNTRNEGSSASARCLPNLTVTKTANTPVVTSATAATASYTINVRNTGGAATNVFLFDTSLPPGWLYSTAFTPQYAYSPAPPFAGGTFAAGAESVTAATVALPLPTCQPPL